MLYTYGDIIAVCSQIHTKHINALCGQNLKLMNVKPEVVIRFDVFFETAVMHN
jgi:hypothetical protein